MMGGIVTRNMQSKATAKNKRNCCILLDLFHYNFISYQFISLSIFPPFFSFHPSTCMNSAANWTDFNKIWFWSFIEICGADPNLVKIGQNNSHFYLKTPVTYDVGHSTEYFVARQQAIVVFPCQHSSVYCCWQWQVAQPNILQLAHGNNGQANALCITLYVY